MKTSIKERRPLGTSGIQVSPVALGCWPIAGMTSRGVSDANSIATLEACFDEGINFLDTAFCYGAQGESERLIARAIVGRREQIVIATKGGIEWSADLKMVRDARPEILRRHCDESLRRLKTDRVDLLYLHSPDEQTPVAESAGELKRLLEEGKTRSVGVSNVSLSQLQEFAAHCPLTAYQPSYNMLQRDIEADRLPWCIEHNVAVVVYWPLLKGLLAGKLARDHAFESGDGRPKYSQFRGDEWQKNHDLLEVLRPIAAECGHTLAQLAINWTIHRPGISVALCGAKRPDQLRDNAGGMGWRLTDDQLARIDAALRQRGVPEPMRAV
ncbi:MAG: aldo/keto reductase [Planctomycetes bacterium]|nr:aldo/keto reductase [Planctomycetota bacterium]